MTNVRFIVAKSNTVDDAVVSTDDDEMVTVTVPKRILRFIPVEPAEFAKIRDDLGMTNKNVAEAIDRTLSRVSELTNSKGASRDVFDRYVAQLTEWRESHPKTESAN